MNLSTNKKQYFFLFILLMINMVSNAQTASIQPVNLRCEFIENPLGVDVQNPVLSWILDATNDDNRGLHQTSYQVLVASSPELLKENKGDLWNSGKVNSDDMNQIKYSGKVLISSQKCWWKVKVWDGKWVSSAWSEPTSWTMGVLNKKDWSAQWITAIGTGKYATVYKSAQKDFRIIRDIAEMRANAPNSSDPNFSSMLLRREFEAKAKLIRAVVHICGLGHYELSVNGKKVGDYILSPGWTNYRKTVLYDTYDITQLILKGNNVIGIELGNGMYNIQADSIRYVKFLNSFGPLKAIARLRLEYDDGLVQILGTDSTWQVSPGPITYSNVFGGEDYDAQRYQSGWNKPGFKNGSRWTSAIETQSPGGELKGLSCAAPPIKVIETLNPVKITQLKPNLWIYDLGQNTSIMPQIRVKGTKGAFVRIIPAELLKSDGTVDRTSATQDGVRPAWWQYTLGSNNHETWFPQFFYQGARYLQVELVPATNDTVLPIIEKLEGIVVHSSATAIGTFSCSNELFNRIYSLVRWAQRSNLMSVITDCPHREKLSWLEQYHLNGPSLRYNFDLTTMFRKGMNDMSDSQLDNGFIPNIAPEFFIASTDKLTDGFRNSPEWGSSFIIVPWQQYLFSGDISLLSRYYEKMKHYVAFLSSTAKDNIINFGLGDWYDLGPKAPWGSQLTPVSLTATAIYYYDSQIMAQSAKLLGKSDDAKLFEQQAIAIRKSFNKTFFNAEIGSFSTGSQTANAMPLFLGIVEPQYRKKVGETIVADIRKRGNAFTSGDVGYRFLLSALAIEGYSNVIFDMNNQSEKPGYGYQLKMGATALTEKWDAGVGLFGSQNHFMLGQINEWFYHDLAGIQMDTDNPGFKHIIIRPNIVGDLTEVKSSYNSIHGKIVSEWRREAEKLKMHVVIPPNTTATIYFPSGNSSSLTENGKQVAKVTGIKLVRSDSLNTIFNIGSGDYLFEGIILKGN